jgi:carboxyl-terminal processing protease
VPAGKSHAKSLTREKYRALSISLKSSLGQSQGGRRGYNNGVQLSIILWYSSECLSPYKGFAMPLRNLNLLALAVLISLACYNIAAKNRYANIFSEAMELIERESLYPKPEQELFISAMDGMMSDLDEHSMFIYGAKFSDMENDIRQEFGGVGMYLEVDSTTHKAFVVAPVPGTPAFEAGIHVGDVIIKINSTEIVDMTRDQVAKLLRGPVNQPVNLTIQRNGEQLEKRIVRAAINTPSVSGDYQTEVGKWTYRLKEYPQIGYIRISLFGEKTVLEVQQAVGELPQDINGLIIDLRNNSGGLLDSAIEVCNFFLPPQKVIVGIQRRNADVQFIYSSKPPIVPADLPVVLLINRYSASASEVVAGCLQDHSRAVVIGEQTFGKATVQNIVPMQRGVSALKLTTASYLRPSGKKIDRREEEFKHSKLWGIQPDPGFLIELSEREVLNAIRDRNIRDLEGLIGTGSSEVLENVRRLRDQLFDSVIRELENRPGGEMPEPETANEPGSEVVPTPHVPYVDPTLKRAIDYLKSLSLREHTIAA